MPHYVEDMVSTKGIVPWHGIGTVLKENLITAEDIIKHVNFDFEVQKRPNSTIVNGKNVIHDDSFSLIRVNKNGSESVLCSTVGKNYTVIQNIEAFDFFDNIVGKGEAIYETAGILKNGRICFLTAVLPDYIKVLREEDKVKSYVLLVNSHDGTTALRAMFTNVRVVCNNTLTAAINSAESVVSIRHTKSAKEKLVEAQRLMGLVNQYNQEISKIFNKMALTNITDNDILDYVNKLIPIEDNDSELVKERKKEKHDLIIDLMENGVGSELYDGKTVWGLYNSTVEMIDHHFNYRNEESRAISLLGNASNLKKESFSLALELI